MSGRVNNKSIHSVSHDSVCVCVCAHVCVCVCVRQVFQQGTSQDLVRFREEVERLKRLEHPQVARLFGVVSKAPYYMITELTINGDLKSFLLSSADREDHNGNPA